MSELIGFPFASSSRHLRGTVRPAWAWFRTPSATGALKPVDDCQAAPAAARANHVASRDRSWREIVRLRAGLDRRAIGLQGESWNPPGDVDLRADHLAEARSGREHSENAIRSHFPPHSGPCDLQATDPVGMLAHGATPIPSASLAFRPDSAPVGRVGPWTRRDAVTGFRDFRDVHCNTKPIGSPRPSCLGNTPGELSRRSPTAS